MRIGRIALYIGMSALWVMVGCSEDQSGTGGTVDTSGACGVICGGGDFNCTIDGFDPSDGLEACTRSCQSEWPSEQNDECRAEATFVISCVDANGSCESLEGATCGIAETDLIDCARMPSGTGGAGGSGGAPMVDVTVEAFSLAVREACDGPGGEGDFFITVRLREETNEDTVVIDENLENLVQSSGGITSLEGLGIVATGAVPAVTGTRILVGTSMFENDSEGPQASVGLNTAYEYDADTPCWRRDGIGECLGPEGEIDVIIIDLVDNNGDPCDAELRSRFSAGPPQ